MVNFGGLDTVPERFRDRNLYVHNPQITLMRTTAEENEAIGRWIGTRLEACPGPLRFLLPEGGVSAIDEPGKPFHDPAADAALFAGIEATLRPRANRRLERLPYPINAPEFAAALVRAYREVCRLMPRFSRAELMERFRAMAARREPIIGGGAGTGLSARCEQAGGIDLIVIYNSGRYRMAGRGSLAGILAYGNANEIVVEMGREVLPVAQRTPVLAGVNGTDPFMLRRPFPGPARRHGLLGDPELSDRGPDRRHLPPGARGDRHGLRARDRACPRRAPAGPPDHALCVRARPGGGHGRSGRRHPGAAYGADHGRRHRRVDRAQARRTARR